MCDEGEEKISIDQRKVKKDKDKDDRKICDGVKIDFGKVRATEMTHNKVIHMPKQCDIRDKIKIQTQRIETMDELKNFVKNRCDENGKIIGAENLTRDELEGLREIEIGIKTKDWMLYVTDKSGLMVLDTKQNFLESMKDHYSGDQEADIKDVIAAEKKINNTARVFADILNVGKDVNQRQRCKETLISNMAAVPTMQGFRKDHKDDVDGDPDKGPPLRPLCGANKSLNAPLGCLVSKILKCVGDELSNKSQTEILSTEELCRFAEDVSKKISEEGVINDDEEVPEVLDDANSQAQRRSQPTRRCKEARKETIKTTVQNEQSKLKLPQIQHRSNRCTGSMDVKALYPSILMEMAGEASEKAIAETDMDLGNINKKSLVRFVAMKFNRKEIIDNDLGNVVPVPKTKTTFNSFANPRGPSKVANGDNQFNAAASGPNKEQVKKLLGMAVKSAVCE
jgi:hypothetical protein